MQRREGAVVITGDDVHEVGMALMKPVQVIVPAKGLVIVAGLPVARGLDAVQQCAVMQYRQVEAAPVPGHQDRCVFFDTLEEAADDIFFGCIGTAQAPDIELTGCGQHDGDCHHSVQMVP